MTLPTTITFDGKTYSMDTFSPKVKTLARIRATWMTTLEEERLAVAKSEAALRELERELAATVGEEIKQQETPKKDGEEAGAE